MAKPKGRIVAYHASSKQLAEFKPSGFRGSTFFASTPKRAVEGAGAGANEMVMDTATELHRGPMFIHQVEIDPTKIIGLHYTPREKKWFQSLPKRIVGDDALEKHMQTRPNSYISWDDLYDHRKIGDRLYEYTKRDTPPSISYEQAYKTGRDVYGRQHAHYAPDGNESATSKRVLAQGMGGHLVQDEAGLSIAMADPSHAKIKGVQQFSNGGDVEGDEDGITAYHGSPHDFEQFDTSKIGTGEGAQSYGHGLYFAGNEDVARDYRERLGKQEETSGETMADQYVIPRHFYQDTSEEELAENMKEAAQWADKKIFDKGKMHYVFDDGSMLIHDDDEVRAVQKHPGHMYEVHIDAHPDHFFDWDEALEDQSDYIKNALRRVAEHDEAEKGYTDLYDLLDEPEGYAGGAFYRNLAERGRDKEASQILNQMGIKGIRYKDAGSRIGNAKPSYNYVVFDHNHVSVKRKYAHGGEVEEYPLRDHTDWEEAHDYEKSGGKLHYEDPRHYLEEVKPLDMDSEDKRTIHHFEKQIEHGEKLDPLAIYPDGHPNGRHRAHAAENVGVKKIPVVTWPKKAGEGSIVNKALMLTSRKA